jgi:hypothetical protein
MCSVITTSFSIFSIDDGGFSGTQTDGKRDSVGLPYCFLGVSCNCVILLVTRVPAGGACWPVVCEALWSCPRFSLWVRCEAPNGQAPGLHLGVPFWISDGLPVLRRLFSLLAVRPDGDTVPSYRPRPSRFNISHVYIAIIKVYTTSIVETGLLNVSSLHIHWGALRSPNSATFCALPCAGRRVCSTERPERTFPSLSPVDSDTQKSDKKGCHRRPFRRDARLTWLLIGRWNVLQFGTAGLWMLSRHTLLSTRGKKLRGIGWFRGVWSKVLREQCEQSREGNSSGSTC